jgi:hypothetical protein
MAFRDIRKSRRFLSPAEIGFLLGVAVLLAALLALNISLARTYQGGEWLYLRWSAARAFLFERVEPYGSTIAERVQHRAYGREAYLNEYPYALNDPFYIVLLYVPLAVLPELISAVFPSLGPSIDFAVVQGIWMLFSELAAVGVVLLTLRFSEWDPPLWMLLLLIGFGLFSGFSLDAFQSASPAILLTFIYLGILSSLQAGADELAGGLLFLVAYQWEVGALFFLLILVLVFANRRWKVLTGLFMTLVTLVAIAILLKSDWMADYARAVLFDWSRQLEYTAATTLSYIFPRLRFPLARWLTLLTGALLFIEALRASDGHFRHIAWAASLSLALSPLAGFAIFPNNHIVLLPAVVLITALVWERWTGLRAILSTLFLILAFLFSHSLYYQWTSTAERIYFDLLKILPPLLALFGLFWMRWWAIRPPRIWADEIGARR